MFVIRKKTGKGEKEEKKTGEKKRTKVYTQAGRAGALSIPEGIAPAVKVVGRAIVAEEDSPAMIEERGTAVGF